MKKKLFNTVILTVLMLGCSSPQQPPTPTISLLEIVYEFRPLMEFVNKKNITPTKTTWGSNGEIKWEYKLPSGWVVIIADDTMGGVVINYHLEKLEKGETWICYPNQYHYNGITHTLCGDADSFPFEGEMMLRLINNITRNLVMAVKACDSLVLSLFPIDIFPKRLPKGIWCIGKHERYRCDYFQISDEWNLEIYHDYPASEMDSGVVAEFYCNNDYYTRHFFRYYYNDGKIVPKERNIFSVVGREMVGEILRKTYLFLSVSHSSWGGYSKYYQ